MLSALIDPAVLASTILSILILAVVLGAILLIGSFVIKGRRVSLADSAAGTTSNFPWRKVALYGGLALVLCAYPVAKPFVHWLADTFYGATATTDSLGNINGAQVEADQVAGGVVPLGTVITKLWITVLFYLLFCSLPWFLQRATHPGPTEWAKSDYTSDFKTALSIEQKFSVYQRLQLVQAIKIVGAAFCSSLIQ